MTNGDRIRQMSNEELAENIITSCKYCLFHMNGEDKKGGCAGMRGFVCKEGIKAYLESEEE
jgi:hypothetical protein